MSGITDDEYITRAIKCGVTLKEAEAELQRLYDIFGWETIYHP